jgi:tyrosine-protein phosphatase YwqE
MKTLTLTDNEFAIVKEALESRNDMVNDTLFENVSVDLFPSVDEPTILHHERARVLREEIDKIIRQQVEYSRLLGKFGITVNEAGYSV